VPRRVGLTPGGPPEDPLPGVDLTDVVGQGDQPVARQVVEREPLVGFGRGRADRLQDRFEPVQEGDLADRRGDVDAADPPAGRTPCPESPAGRR
jgi:hypothetical protein